ncbi:MAG: hypothetical protein AAGI24_15610 [Pseudomonadota bacterium]
MDTNSQQSDNSYRGYVSAFLGLLGAVALVNTLGAAAFLWEPRHFYYRPWEYFYELGYRFAAYEPAWHQAQSADLSRQNWFFYQGSHYTDVTTDADGYRSVPINAGTYPVLVSGDSLVFGSGLSDAETMPWRLAERLDMPVFNGGRSSLFNTLKKTELEDAELVIDVRGEPLIKGAVFADYGYTADEPYRPRVTNQFSRWEALREVAPQRYLLTHIAGRMLRRLGRDLMVLRAGARERCYMPYQLDERTLASAADAIQSRSERLRAMGKRYIFVGVPFEQTLYADHISDKQRQYLTHLNDELARRGVETISLLPLFIEQRDREIFQRYDTHWSPLGVDLAVQAICEHLSRDTDMGLSCSAHAR